MASIITSTHQGDIDYVRASIPCQSACPVFTDIPQYIDAIRRGNHDLAYEVNLQANLLPGVLGRICSRPCENACRHGDAGLGASVSICHLKRAAADLKKQERPCQRQLPETGKSVGVVGLGPAGIALSYWLSALGHKVTAYEAMPELGGMLHYGIPAFRLPRELIKQEVAHILSIGIEVVHAFIGRDISVEELLSKHQAVVLATGCSLGKPLGIPGDHLQGFYSGLNFMTMINEGGRPEVGEKVVVLGGGFTAMDCARSAIRLGAKEVTIAIRTTEEEITVTKGEVFETKHEGVNFVSLVSSTEIVGNGKINGIRFIRTRLGRKKGSGSRVAIPIDGSEFLFPADTVIAAIGQEQEKEVLFKGLNVPLSFDVETGASPLPGLYAAGDFVGGASTVIDAMGHARLVADAIDQHLMGAGRIVTEITLEDADDTDRKRAWDYIPVVPMPELELSTRFRDASAEVETGFDQKQGETEAMRCYLCNLKYEIDIPNCIYCRLCIEQCPRDCIHLVSELSDGTEGLPGGRQMVKTEKWDETAGVVIDSARCIRCGICLRVCPTRCIHVKRMGLVNRCHGG